MKFGALILAAGAENEMKGFRPMLHVDGKAMIEYIVDTLHVVGAEPIAVVTGYRAAALKRLLRDADVEFVENRRYDTGAMFDSVLLGVRALTGRCDRLIIIPADIPLVKPETVRELAARGGEIVRPEYRGRPGHPVILSGSAARRLLAYEGEGGLRDALQSLCVTIEDVPVEDEAVLMDVNTRGEYERIRELRRLRTHGGELRAEYELRLAVDDVIMDREIMRLLEMVECTGSLQTASECVDSSYTRSWRQIKKLEQQLGVPVLQSSAGGVKGGGSRLTEQGATLLKAYEGMQREGQRMMNWIFKEHFSEEVVKKLQKKG